MEQSKQKSAIKFLSFSNDKEDAEKQAKLQEAAARIEQAIVREKSLGELIDYDESTNNQETVDPSNDPRSLYDRLLEQKNKKKEEVEESQKMSKMISTLDEDDINFLDEVAKNKREEEIRKRLEVYDTLEEKKRLGKRKLDEEEQKMKAMLTGKSSFGLKKSSAASFLKSKLNSIKIRPRMKPQSEKNEDEKQKSDEEKSTTNVVSNKQSSGSDDEHQKEILRKRLKLDETSENPSKSDNVMKCIGMLPSLPIVTKSIDSDKDSDKDSSSSDDELCQRLVPRISNRRKKIIK